ncbi:MAG: S-layer homology domain-containing protein, partial [Eubacteriales bacterium]
AIKIEGAVGDKRVDVKSFNKYISYNIQLPDSAGFKYTAAISLDNAYFFPVPNQLKSGKGSGTVIIKTRNSGTFAVVGCQRVFTDLKSHWARGAISNLVSKLIVNGVNDKYFAPGKKVTRAEFAVMIAKALGLQPQSGSIVFVDVKGNAWYSGAVASAVEAGIIQGYSDLTFKPNAFIKREEAACMIIRALEYTGVSLNVDDSNLSPYLKQFRDSGKISSWAKPFVSGAVDGGLMKGYNKGIFAPGQNITRAESAALVVNLLVKSDLG